MRESMCNYRGKANKNNGPCAGQWVFGSVVLFGDGTVCIYQEQIGHLPPVDHETVGQFTGLYDKHGVKVYEGDKLEIQQEMHGTMTCVAWFPMCKSCLENDGYDLATLEVVGNVHEDKK